MASNTPAPFSWGEIELSQTVFVEHVPHATRQAIGEWLEYADPQNAIDVLLKRNLHIEHYSIPVNLTAVDGKNRQVSVYHPIGFLLLVMESGQPKAQAMKVAVAEFVWHFAGPREMTFKDEMHNNSMLREVAKVSVHTHCTEFEENLHALDTIADAIRCARGEIDDIGVVHLIRTVSARMWTQSLELRSLAERM